MHINSFLASEVKVLKYQVLPSTNDLAKELIQHNKAEEGLLIWVDEQTAGRGQQGTIWQSASGQNILCTLILKPSFLTIEQQTWLNMALSLAICDAIKQYLPQAQIKWPNDIYCNQQKLGGLLIENVLQGHQIKYVLFGFGLNINQTTNLYTSATSIKKETGNDTDRNEVLNYILQEVEKRYAQLQLKQFSKINFAYHQVLLGWKQEREFSCNNQRFWATVEGVNEFGQLLLNKNGEVHKYLVKQVVWI